MSGELLGLIHSYGITHALIITPTEVHAKRTGLGFRERHSTAYLGPRSTATEEQRRTARVVIDRINHAKLDVIERHQKDKEFTVDKESIIRITMKLPGEFRTGHVIFKTLGDEFRVSILPLASKVENARSILLALIPSLLEFAPDRFYDEKSGKLVSELLKEGMKWHEGWGISWRQEKPRNQAINRELTGTKS
jgi:hypothetical protein